MSPIALEAAPPRPVWQREAIATLALALPIAATNLSGFLIVLTEAAMLGRVGTEGLAAAALGINLFWALMTPVFGLAQAATPLLAQARGAGQRTGRNRGWLRGLREALWATLGLVLAASVPCMLLLWFGEALLLALGQDPLLAALAGDYLRAFLWGLPGFGVFIALRGLISAFERPAAALWVSLAGVALNAALCAVLIFGLAGMPALGVVGAGIAGAVTEIAMGLALLGVILADRRLRRLRLFVPPPRVPWAAVRQALNLGLPIVGQLTLEIGVFSAAALAVGWLGADALAAHTIAVQVAGLTFMVPMGIAQAASARVGLAAGAGDLAAARRAGWTAIALGAGFMLAMAGTLALLSGVLPQIFLGSAGAGSPVALLAAQLLVIAGLFQLFDGVQAVAGGALRGLGDARVPMLLAALGYWGFGLPIGLALGWPAGLGAPGMWLGLAVGLAIVSALLVRRWATAASRPTPSLAPALLAPAQ